jgi:putative phosphoribosyl transferase
MSSFKSRIQMICHSCSCGPAIVPPGKKMPIREKRTTFPEKQVLSKSKFLWLDFSSLLSMSYFNFGHRPLFQNRKDAGEQLALSLEVFKKEQPVILGIARGGVEVAYYVSRALGCEFSVVVSKKLPYPGNAEYGFGAVSEEGEFYVSPERGILPEHVIELIVKERTSEVNRRVEAYRKGKALPEMKNKVVILIDDGIATGSTIVPLIRFCKKKDAAKVVVAAPVSGKSFDKELYEADEIIVLHQPEEFMGVGQAYKDFSQLDDEDVLRFMGNSYRKAG